MGLETANTINELVEAWPLQSDKIRQGAGHLRAIKKAVKTTFPNITEPMTRTAAALNQLPADFSAFLTELLKHVEKRGSIKMWDLAIFPTLPEGWVMCLGQQVDGYGTVPDMRDRFIVGAGGSYANRSAGGSISKATTGGGAHAHNGTTGGTALSLAQMPNHGHRVYMNDTSAGGSGKNLWALDNAPSYKTTSANSGGNALVEPQGGGQAHDHPISLSDGSHEHSIADVRPPFVAVVFIVKTGVDFVMP